MRIDINRWMHTELLNHSNSAQRGASIGHLLNDNCRETSENTRRATKISREMVAMPTGAEQPDQLTSPVNC